MDFKGFVDKAKEAAAAVANEAKSAMATPAALQTPGQTPGQIPGQTGAPENIEAAMAQGAEQAPDQAIVPASPEGAVAPAKSFSALASEKINQLSAVGSEKIQELVTSFQQALPALKSAGYELTEFEIELGVTPKLIPHFKHAARSDEDVAAARDALKDNKLGQILLGALLKAGDVHKQIRVAGFGFSHIEIEMGLIPSVRLQYKKD